MRRTILLASLLVAVAVQALAAPTAHHDANQPIADRSAYTVIVARRINISAGPNVVLNTDYNGTDVPVPDGVGPRKPHAYLAD